MGKGSSGCGDILVQNMQAQELRDRERIQALLYRSSTLRENKPDPQVEIIKKKKESIINQLNDLSAAYKEEQRREERNSCFITPPISTMMMSVAFYITKGAWWPTHLYNKIEFCNILIREVRLINPKHKHSDQETFNKLFNLVWFNDEKLMLLFAEVYRLKQEACKYKFSCNAIDNGIRFFTKQNLLEHNIPSDVADVIFEYSRGSAGI